MSLEESTINFILVSSYITLGFAIFFTFYIWYKQKFTRIYLWFLGSFILEVISLFIWTRWLTSPVYLEPELAPTDSFTQVAIATLLWIFSMILLLIGIAKKDKKACS